MTINKYKYFVYFIVFYTPILSQSMQELKKMRDEYEKYKQNQSIIDVPSSDIDNINPLSGRPQQAQIFPYQVNERDLAIDKKNRHFGYDFFTQRDTISFWENLPTPSNYLLGPGDELIISIWGETQLRETYIISREGKIYDEKVGLLHLGGLKIDEAHDYFINQFGRVYSTLSSNKPSTFLDISLGELRSINVNFVGYVKYPGVYPVHPFSNLITGLIQAGGVDTTGSLRKIEIKRDGSSKTIDLYDYFIKGELSSTIQLRDQDIVVVPPRASFVFIDSAVVRPGIYESVDGEKVNDMINYAGGLSYDAADKVGIRKLKRKPERKNGQQFESFYVDYANTNLIPVNTGDEILIRRIFDDKQQVQIIGQVKIPGFYHYYDGMEFKDLLELSGGIQDSTFRKSVYTDQSEIIRRNPASRYDEVINVNLKKVINEKEIILLQNLDKIVIHSNLNFFEKENILILGEVKIPGAYPLTSDDESLKSFINRAGGLSSRALTNGIEIYRKKKFFDTKLSNETLVNKAAINRGIDRPVVVQGEESNNELNAADKRKNDKVRVAWQNTDISLMPGDSVVVKEKTSTIFVTGAIYNPGVLEFRQGKSLRFYINSAGGLTDQANKKGIVILYANGIVSPKRWYSNPKVLEGSTIIVNHKLNDEPFDITQFATNWTSIISSLVTAVILSRQI